MQAKLKAPKSQYNKFGNFYYRSCEDILEAVKPLLEENNSALVTTHEVVLIGDRYYVKATAKFIDDATGNVVESSAYAREATEKKGMSSEQVTGSCISYATKYALNGLLAIDDTKDADTTNNGEEVKSKATSAPKPVEKVVTQQPTAPKTETVEKYCDVSDPKAPKVITQKGWKLLTELSEAQLKVVRAKDIYKDVWAYIDAMAKKDAKPFSKLADPKEKPKVDDEQVPF